MKELTTEQLDNMHGEKVLVRYTDKAGTEKEAICTVDTKDRICINEDNKVLPYGWYQHNPIKQSRAKVFQEGKDHDR